MIQNFLSISGIRYFLQESLRPIRLDPSRMTSSTALSISTRLRPEATDHVDGINFRSALSIVRPRRHFLDDHCRRFRTIRGRRMSPARADHIHTIAWRARFFRGVETSSYISRSRGIPIGLPASQEVSSSDIEEVSNHVFNKTIGPGIGNTSIGFACPSILRTKPPSKTEHERIRLRCCP